MRWPAAMRCRLSPPWLGRSLARARLMNLQRHSRASLLPTINSIPPTGTFNKSVMSDNNSADDGSSERPMTPVKKTQTEPKGKGKRAASPGEYAPSDAAVDSEGEEDQQEDDEDEDLTPRKKQRGKGTKNGSKKSTPVKKPETSGTGSSSPSGKSGWTKEQKKELFKALVGHPKRADCNEIAPKIGKTPKQCIDAWNQTILPSVLKKLEEP